MIAIGCAHDHVHSVIRLASSVSLGELVRRMKGASAYEMNHDPKSRRRIVWQEGYWAESFDPADFGSLLHYVRHQRDHHDDSHPAERWAATAPDVLAPIDDLDAAIDTSDRALVRPDQGRTLRSL